ncbi:MAG: FYVE zinc finger domain-containing protein [Sandaracinaceae bacterium]|nr:FYVE zinc finger domain-containing protein [Sandaracinaceae bacterium]
MAKPGSCKTCGVAFGLFRWRHPCTSCGGTHCASCVESVPAAASAWGSPSVPSWRPLRFVHEQHRRARVRAPGPGHERRLLPGYVAGDLPGKSPRRRRSVDSGPELGAVP